MDALVEIPRSRWPEVRDQFLARWPHGLPGYSMLHTQIQHPALGDAYGVKVFCPYGELGSGVVAFNNKGPLKEVIILTVSENTQKLEDALAHTKVIDWSDRRCVPWADSDVMGLVHRLLPRLGLKLLHEAPAIKHYKSKTSEPYTNVVCPPNTYTAPLKTEHIPRVDEVWPHRFATSPRLLELLIQCGLSYGLFSNEDHSLLAWVFINEVGFVAHLYCEENHRKKGYAEFLMKFVANDQMRQGNDVFCCIVEGNVKSITLLRKLDFDIIGRGVWMFVRRDNAQARL